MIALVVVLSGGFLWALPEIVRRVAVAQFPALTGRVLSIEDIDLNLFTGRLVLKKLRISERNPAETFVQADRISLRLVPFTLMTGNLVLADVSLTAPEVRIIRIGPAEFNFSDLLSKGKPSDPNEPKGDWTLSIDRFTLIDGSLLFGDRAVSPARNWRIQGLTIEAGGLSTRAAHKPGHVAVRARVNDAELDASANAIVLTAGGFTVHVGLDRFDLTQVRPYLPPDLPVSLQSGTLGVALDVAIERGDEGLKRATVSGDVRLESLAVARPDQPAPFFKLPRLAVAIETADFLASSVTLKSVEIEGLDLRAVRDPAGEIDLLALAGKSSEAPTDSNPAAAPAPAGKSSEAPTESNRAAAPAPAGKSSEAPTDSSRAAAPAPAAQRGGCRPGRAGSCHPAEETVQAEARTADCQVRDRCPERPGRVPGPRMAAFRTHRRRRGVQSIPGRCAGLPKGLRETRGDGRAPAGDHFRGRHLAAPDSARGRGACDHRGVRPRTARAVLARRPACRGGRWRARR